MVAKNGKEQEAAQVAQETDRVGAAADAGVTVEVQRQAALDAALGLSPAAVVETGEARPVAAPVFVKDQAVDLGGSVLVGAVNGYVLVRTPDGVVETLREGQAAKVDKDTADRLVKAGAVVRL